MNRWFWAWLVAITALVAGLLVIPTAQATVTGTLTGTVTDATNHGVKGVVAELITDDQHSTVVSTATTALNGTYSLTAPAGVYRLCFDGADGVRATSVGGYLTRCYGGAHGYPWNGDPTQANSLPVTVVGAQANGGYNISLAAGGGIAGTVTAASGGAGLAGVHVVLYSATDANSAFDIIGSAVTAADGTYLIDGIDPSGGGLGVCFDATAGAITGGTSTTGYESQCWNNQPWLGHQLPSGFIAVTPVAGQVTSSINAALAAGSSISGRVTDGASGGVSGVSVLVYTLANGQLATGLGSAVTDGSGNYTVSGLQPNSAGYDVCFDAHHAAGGSSTTGYLGECYRNIGWNDNDNGILPSATAVPLTGGQTLTGIDQSLSAAGAISGKVTAGGLPLGNVHVTVAGGASGVFTTNTAADGTYSVPGLYPGTSVYWVCFDPSQATGGTSTSGYEGQCYNGKYWDTSLGDVPTTVTHLSVTAGATTSGINASLVNAGGLSGTVTSGGQPVGDVTVLVYSVASGYLATGYSTVTTASNGTYTVKGLKPGVLQYRVCFDTTVASGGPSSTGYTDQCWNNKPWDGFSSPTSTKVTVTGSALTPGINASLTVGGQITGHVTSAAGGTAVGNVNVYVVPISDLSVSTGFASAVTAADGSYTVKRLPASSTGYAVCFDPSAATGGGSTTGYLDQCANNQAWGGQFGNFPAGLTAVPVTGGGSATVDAQLGAAGALSGKVIEAGTSAPLAGTVVSLYTTDGSATAFGATTTPDGTYRINGLVPGTGYVACFDPTRATGGGTTGHIQQCYKNQSWDGYNLPPGATAVNVTAGAVTGAVNATVKQAGAISGTVTASVGGSPVPNASVSIYDASRNYITNVIADNAGHYSVTNLAPSTRGYLVCVDGGYVLTPSAPAGYLDQCYNGVAWNGMTQPPTVSAKIPLAAGQTATANFSLGTASGISGTVTSGATPLGSASVSVFDSHGNPVGGAGTADNGTYLVSGLAPSTTGYYVCFSGTYANGGSSPAGYQSACWKNKPWLGQYAPPVGTKVPLGTAQVATGISISLGKGGGISGTLTTVNGPVSNAFINVYDLSGALVGTGYSNFDGTYSVIGLRPTTTGDIVCFDVSSAGDGTSASLLDQCYQNVAWDGTTLPAGAQPVEMAPGAIHSGIDATIAVAGSISGQVTEQSGGAPVADATVVLFDASGNEVTTTGVDSNGAYTFGGVKPGNWQVCAQPGPAETDNAECYNGVPWDLSFPVTTGTPIPVAASQNVTGIDMALPPAA